MIHEENKALVRLFDEEFWNKGNSAAADELMTANATIFLPGSGPGGLHDLQAFALAWRGAFPDWLNTTDEMIAEGARVVERWTGRGTHQGEFQGIAPTRRQVAVSGVVFYRFESGKITEFRGLFDNLFPDRTVHPPLPESTYSQSVRARQARTRLASRSNRHA